MTTEDLLAKTKFLQEHTTKVFAFRLQLEALLAYNPSVQSKHIRLEHIVSGVKVNLVLEFIETGRQEKLNELCRELEADR